MPWLGLVNKGLFDIDHPHWAGWSGRFSREKVENYWSKHQSVRVDEEKVAPFRFYQEEADNWVNPENGDVYEGIFVPVWRWRRAFFNDFVCRMDWCTQSFEQANHHPRAVVNGDAADTILSMNAETGAVLRFDANGSSDPDGDALALRWFVYPEPAA